MMSWRWQKVGLLLGWLVVSGLGGCSLGKSDEQNLPLAEDEIAKKAKEFTVIIDGCGAGSGAIIEREGNTYSVLTAYHVVDQPHLTCLIMTSDQEVYQVKGDTVTQPVPEVDLGVLTFSSDKSYPVATLGDSEKVGELTSVYVVGAPGSSRAIGARTLLFNSGKITGRVPQPKDGYILIYDANTQPGMSGGPVLNRQGEIVGVHGQGDRDEKGIKTGWNLGIPIQIFINPASYASLKQQQKTTANDYYSQGIAFLNEKDYPAALVSFDQATNLDPNMDEAFWGRGTANYWLDNKQETIKDCTEAIRINPQNAYAYFRRGLVYDGRGYYKLAIDDYTKAIALDPNDAAAYNNRGIIYSYYEKYDEAIEDYTKAIALDPNDAFAYNNRGIIYSYYEKYDAAIKDYTKAIALDQNDAAAYNNRGIAYRKKGKYDAAIKDYTKAIALDPNYADAYGNRCLIYRERGDYQKAIADCNKALEINPQHVNNYRIRALTYRKQGKYDEAIKDYTKAIALDPNYADAYGNRGSAYYKKEQYDSAIADFKKAIELDNNDADSYYMLGLIDDETGGDFQTAIENYEKAAELYQKQGNDFWYNKTMNKLEELRGY